MSGEPRLIASFGRRRGRRLRTGKQELYDQQLPALMLNIPHEGIVNPAQLFPGKQEIWLEIGFGGGEHMAHVASLHPQAGIIGCEPYINGIAGLLAHIERQKLSNIRIHTDDARPLMERFSDASISRVFILYPDPWPKARHHKRRLVSRETLDLLARIMKPGALLRLATDSSDYATWMLERLLAHPDFRWTAKGPEDWLNPWAEWISTRYEQKALAGRPTYLEFIRL